MKYWRGYIAAAICALIAWALTTFCASHGTLVDMFYPYCSRLIQTSLASWCGGVDFCLWQVLAVLGIVILLSTIVLMIIFKWNVIQWLGWALASVSLLYMMHVGVYGLNYHAGPLADDIRLTVTDYSLTHLVNATTYFRDMANELADDVPRNDDGTTAFPSFSEMAEVAGDGYHTLTYDRSYPVFAGSTEPVKELGWADMYTSMGIFGVTMPLTGEAAVNPNIPDVAIPFTMCHEMAHRMCIAQERDANLAGFLACDANSDPVFRYSGYFMAFHYCYNALTQDDSSAAITAAKQIYEGLNDYVRGDIDAYNAFFDANIDSDAVDFATSVNDTYIKTSGDEAGVDSYDDVTGLLVSWHLQEIYYPAHQDEAPIFNPLDKDQVDLG